MKQRIEISKLEDKVGKNCEKEEEKEKTLKKNEEGLRVCRTT